MNLPQSQPELTDGESASQIRERGQRGSRPRSRGPVRDGSWGLKAPYNLMRKVTGILGRYGSLHRLQLSERLGNRIAATEIALGSLAHLGLVERLSGNVKLTAAGERYARSLNTREEPDAFCPALLSYEPFRELWGSLTEAPTGPLHRRDVMRVLTRRYHYSRQVTENTASHILGYAVAAGLCVRSGRGNEYSTNLSRWEELTKGPPTARPAIEPAVSRSVSGGRSRKAGGRATFRAEVVGLLAWLAWALADDKIFEDVHRRESIRGVARDVAEQASGTAWEVLAELAEETITGAFESNDRDDLRWAIRALRGMMHAEDTFDGRVHPQERLSIGTAESPPSGGSV